jgi:hypothetical protein
MITIVAVVDRMMMVRMRLARVAYGMPAIATRPNILQPFEPIIRHGVIV